MIPAQSKKHALGTNGRWFGLNTLQRIVLAMKKPVASTFTPVHGQGIVSDREKAKQLFKELADEFTASGGQDTLFHPTALGNCIAICQDDAIPVRAH
jgi:hypothetical protein